MSLYKLKWGIQKARHCARTLNHPDICKHPLLPSTFNEIDTIGISVYNLAVKAKYRYISKAMEWKSDST